MFSLYSEFLYLVCTMYLFNAMAGYTAADHETGGAHQWSKLEAGIAGIPACGALIWPFFYGHWWLGFIAWVASGLLGFALREMMGAAIAVVIGLPMLAFGAYHLSMPWWR